MPVPVEMPAPKFATERDLSRPTLGDRQGRFAEIWLGRALMPWQQLVADVGGELVQNEAGVWVPAHKVVVVTVQRQAGKSHLSMAQLGERAFSRPGFKAWYTAQTGQDARDQFLKFADDVVEGQPLAKIVRTMRGRGEEMMRFPNRSFIRSHPPTEEKLHGKQSDRNDIDEAWAFTEERGKALLQAIAPTQATRWMPQAGEPIAGAQTWIWSAGGTAGSTWLADLVARGRAGDPSICYFEWGVPDDLDINDLEAVARHHPAYGITINAEALESMRAQLTDDAEFARAAGNRWTEVIGGAIPWDSWLQQRWTEAIPDDVPVGYGAARAADGTQVAIAAAADVDGTPVVEILDVLPTAWNAAEHVAGWSTDGPVAVAPDGPSATLADALAQRRRLQLLTVSNRDYSAACADVVDALEPRAIRYRPSDELDAAVKVAGMRSLSDGGWLWARRSASAPIATIEAATLAVYALRHRRPSVGRPRILTATR